jgi:hypothetical protein
MRLVAAKKNGPYLFQSLSVLGLICMPAKNNSISENPQPYATPFTIVKF